MRRRSDEGVRSSTGVLSGGHGRRRALSGSRASGRASAREWRPAVRERRSGAEEGQESGEGEGSQNRAETHLHAPFRSPAGPAPNPSHGWYSQTIGRSTIINPHAGPGGDGVSVPEGARHQVTCADVDMTAGAGHEHVVRIGTSQPDGSRRRWTLVEVVTAWRAGEIFSIESQANHSVELRPSVCPRCQLVTIAAEPTDAIQRLPACAGQAT